MTGLENAIEQEGDNKKQWLESLQVGDTVAVRRGSFGYPYYEFRKIKKITPTRRFVLEGLETVTFSNNGREMGKRDTWSNEMNMELPTERIQEAVLRRKMLQKIQNINFDKLPTDILVEIYTSLDKVN